MSAGATIEARPLRNRVRGSARRPGQRAPAVVKVDLARCVHCGLCTGVCGSGALSMNPDSWELAFAPARCNGCARCLETCPLGAIRDGRC